MITTTKRFKIISATLVVAFSTVVAAPLALADRFDQQIKQLQTQNNQTAVAQDGLESAARDLSSQVSSLQSEISQVNSQLSSSQQQKTDIEAKIAQAEKDLNDQRSLLGDVVRQMYIDDGMSSIEMLATSNNLSDYIDKEQYRSSVQSQATETMNQINDLQKDLNAKKLQVDRLISDQTAMRASTSAKQSEVSGLLSMNKQQQTSYDAAISDNNKKITDLKKQQAIENARYNIGKVQTGGTGGYPWAGVAFPNTAADPWGMYKRQCVSYTAWRVAVSGRHMPYWGGHGNAKLWDDNARAAGIPVDTKPKVGDIAVSNAGTYGHVMYVEAVHSDGTITVSQYNASWDGNYSMVRKAVTNLVFIHF